MRSIVNFVAGRHGRVDTISIIGIDWDSMALPKRL